MPHGPQSIPGADEIADEIAADKAGAEKLAVKAAIKRVGAVIERKRIAIRAGQLSSRQGAGQIAGGIGENSIRRRSERLQRTEGGEAASAVGAHPNLQPE